MSSKWPEHIEFKELTLRPIGTFFEFSHACLSRGPKKKRLSIRINSCFFE